MRPGLRWHMGVAEWEQAPRHHTHQVLYPQRSIFKYFYVCLQKYQSSHNLGGGVEGGVAVGRSLPGSRQTGRDSALGAGTGRATPGLSAARRVPAAFLATTLFFLDKDMHIKISLS